MKHFITLRNPKSVNWFGGKGLDNLNEELKAYAKILGVDLFGVADLSQAKDQILSQGGQHIGVSEGGVPGDQITGRRG